MKKIIVAQDVDSSDECLYIDGKAWAGVGETTIYACDIASYAQGNPIVFDLVRVQAPEHWPSDFDDLTLADD